MNVRAFGSWPSPITSASLVEGRRRLSRVQLGPRGVAWQEGRPEENGRGVVMTVANRAPVPLTPEGTDVRSRCHEYGGGAYALTTDGVVYVNAEDQRVYRIAGRNAPRPLTPPPPAPRAHRYADLVVDERRRRVLCVEEVHGEGEPVNRLVSVSLDEMRPPVVLHEGHDFYAGARVSPDGASIAWITWDHPRMPWQGSDAWLARIRSDGHLDEARHVAGGHTESVCQPEFDAHGTLHVVSDRSGWWNLYRVTESDLEPVAPMHAECGRAHWIFGTTTYAFLSGDRIACVRESEGREELVVLEPGEHVRPLALPYTDYGDSTEIVSDGASRVAFVGASPVMAPEVVTVDVDTGRRTVLRVESDLSQAFALDAAPPEHVEVPSANGRTTFAFLHAPHAADGVSSGGVPPLLVKGHGGPTSAASSAFSLGTRYWTSRGLAVAEVNYGGSTGYGRAYRERLDGAWGVVDREDCVATAAWLAREGRVDGTRMAVRGGSAGGYTALTALVFDDVFRAGASHYGVADLEALANTTHKFEKHYLDSLVGPYPETKDRYRARSPIHHADRLSCPLILLQGTEDRVVPPAQSDQLADALRAKGLPFAYLRFDGEGHGFRKAPNQRRAIEAELYFYGRVFGFTPADAIAPIRIENEEALS